MRTTPRSVSAIVDEQVQRWQMQRRKEPGKPSQAAPIITVSRQYGARGGVIAQRVAERLGFQCWNHELITEMARHAHADEQGLAAFDEHHRAGLVDAISGIIPKHMLNPSDYFRELTHVVHTISRHGRAVIVGRGVQFLLDPATVLRIRVVGPVEQRARRVMERDHIDERAARQAVDEADRDRRGFIRDHYNRDIDDPCAYDVWLNMAYLTLDGAADITVSAFRARFTDAALASATL